MVIRRSSTIAVTQWLLFFIYFGGYYASLALSANIFGNDLSRLLTVPLRVLILALAVVLLFNNPKLELPKGLFFLLLFSFAYLARIIIEISDPASIYQRPVIEFLLFFLSFFFIPLVAISQVRFFGGDYQRILHGILFGCFFLALLTILFYGSIIGEVARISAEIKRYENYISPLALSYVSTLGIVVAVSYITTNTSNWRVRVYFFAGAGLCLVPFFLGSTRGSLIAGAGALLFYLTFAKSIKNRFLGILMVIIVTSALFFAQDFLGTGVFDRFFRIKGDIQSGSSSIVRLSVWSDGFRQFLEHPLFGNSLESEYTNFHPHNILIEVLISTGVVGFVPFVIFIGYTIIKSIKITRHAPQFYWIVCIFLIGLIQNQFSGAIYSASWLAMGAALVLGFDVKTIYSKTNETVVSGKIV